MQVFAKFPLVLTPLKFYLGPDFRQIPTKKAGTKNLLYFFDIF